MLAALLVAIGGAVGAVGRYVVDRAVMALTGTSVTDGGFPWGTVVVNVTGTMLLAMLFVIAEHAFDIRRELWLLLAVGVLGSYTTFSTVALDAVLLGEAGRPAYAAVYLLVMPLSGFAAGLATYAAGKAIIA